MFAGGEQNVRGSGVGKGGQGEGAVGKNGCALQGGDERVSSGRLSARIGGLVGREPEGTSQNPAEEVGDIGLRLTASAAMITSTPRFFTARG